MNALSPNHATLFLCNVQGAHAKRSVRSTGSALDFAKLVDGLLDPKRKNDPDYDPTFSVIRRAGTNDKGFKCRPHWRLSALSPHAAQMPGDASFQGRAAVLEGGDPIPLGAEVAPWNALQLPTALFGECGASFALVPSAPSHWVIVPEEPEVEVTEEAPRLPEGVWGWKKEDVPKGAILVYEIGKTYVSGNGLVFTIFEQPRMVSGKPGYWVGPVLLADATVGVLVWGPKTKPRRGAIASALRRWFFREETA
jgi:hypothetical protein